MIVSKNTNYNFLGESKNKGHGLLSKEKKLKNEGAITSSKDKKLFLKDGSLRNLGIIDKEI
jgi:hypothetical protein